MGDLLRNQRKYRYRRPSPYRKWLALLVLCGAAYGVYWFAFSEADFTVHSELDGAYQEAMLVVSEAMHIAADQVVEEVVESSVESEPVVSAQALSATWQEGSPVVVAGVLEKNESVFLALQARNISQAAIHNVVTATGKEFNFRRSRPGDSWVAEVAADGTITRFRYQSSPEDVFVTTRDENGQYTCKKDEVKVEARIEVIGGAINNTFWQALEATGEQGGLAFRFMEIFAFTIDFNTETREGDQFALVFEKKYLDGKFLRYGRLLAAKYVGPTGTHYAFHNESKGERGYYDLKGENLARQFLRSPLPVTRITSRFGRRVHPVLGSVRDHQGVDYGAPTGTPVQSVADGVITFSGWKGANGKLVAVRHSGGFETYYAHLSEITKGITAGKRVTRGQLIGKVGTTGRSTGPHLHFGMKKNSKYVDPLKVDAMRGDPLKGAELDRFTQGIVNPYRQRLEEALEGTKPAPIELAGE